MHLAVARYKADLHRGKIMVYFRWGDRLVYNTDLGHWAHGQRRGGSSSWAARWVNMPGYAPEIHLLAHEVGHYLHNRHTFEDNKATRDQIAEKMRRYHDEEGHDKDDCPLAIDRPYDGNFVLDTPPDPGRAVWGDSARIPARPSISGSPSHSTTVARGSTS